MGEITHMPDLPEQQARQVIDAILAATGWSVQDYKAFDLSASIGIALRKVPLKSGAKSHFQSGILNHHGSRTHHYRHYIPTAPGVVPE
jgi:hypothetical protein